MNFKPLSDRVLVKLQEAETMKNGIYIPERAKEKSQRGEAILVGPGRLDAKGNIVPMNVKAGDKVLLGKFAGVEVKLEEQDYILVHEDDILGIEGNVDVDISNEMTAAAKEILPAE